MHQIQRLVLGDDIERGEIASKMENSLLQKIHGETSFQRNIACMDRERLEQNIMVHSNVSFSNSNLAYIWVSF